MLSCFIEELCMHALLRSRGYSVIKGLYLLFFWKLFFWTHLQHFDLVNKCQNVTQQQKILFCTEQLSLLFTKSTTAIKNVSITSEYWNMVQLNMFTCICSEVCALLVLRVTGKLSAACAGVNLSLWAEVRLCLTTMTSITAFCFWLFSPNLLWLYYSGEI